MESNQAKEIDKQSSQFAATEITNKKNRNNCSTKEEKGSN
jgi:hypothetical protein